MKSSDSIGICIFVDVFSLQSRHSSCKIRLEEETDFLQVFILSYFPLKCSRHTLPHPIMSCRTLEGLGSCYKALIDKFCAPAGCLARSHKTKIFNQTEQLSIMICVEPKESDFSPSCSKRQTKNNGIQITHCSVPYQISDLQFFTYRKKLLIWNGKQHASMRDSLFL